MEPQGEEMDEGVYFDPVHQPVKIVGNRSGSGGCENRARRGTALVPHKGDAVRIGPVALQVGEGVVDDGGIDPPARTIDLADEGVAEDDEMVLAVRLLAAVERNRIDAIGAGPARGTRHQTLPRIRPADLVLPRTDSAGGEGDRVGIGKGGPAVIAGAEQIGRGLGDKVAKLEAAFVLAGLQPHLDIDGEGRSGGIALVGDQADPFHLALELFRRIAGDEGVGPGGAVLEIAVADGRGVDGLQHPPISGQEDAKYPLVDVRIRTVLDGETHRDLAVLVRRLRLGDLGNLAAAE